MVEIRGSNIEMVVWNCSGGADELDIGTQDSPAFSLAISAWNLYVIGMDMISIKINFFGHLLPCLLLVAGQVGAQESKIEVRDSSEWNDESRELFGYLESAFANSSAIRKGDCLFRVVEIYDSVNYGDKLNLDGVLDRSETLFRLRFDYDANKASIALSRVVERTDLGLDDPDHENSDLRTTTQNLYANCIDPESESAFSFITGRFSGKRYLSKNSGARAIRSQKLPELRSLGWTAGYEANNYALFKSWIRGSEAGRHLLELRRRTASEIEFRKYTVAKRDPKQEHFYTDFTVDLSNLTIVSTISYHHYGESGVVTMCAPKSKLKWKEISDVQVPIQVFYTTIASRSGASGERHWGSLDHRMDLHWFSVNEPIDPSAFDGSEIETAASIRSVLDPETNGATDLAKLMRRGNPVEIKQDKSDKRNKFP